MSLLRAIYKAIRNKDTSGPWKEFAGKNNGNYVYERGDMVMFFHKGFKIVFNNHTHYTTSGMSSYERTFLKAVTEFNSPDKLYLKILPQDLVESIGKLLGSQDIEVGDKNFDRKFIIKGNDPEKTQLILANDSISQMLLEQRAEMVRLEVTDDYGLFSEKAPEGQSMLILFQRKRSCIPNNWNV